MRRCAVLLGGLLLGLAGCSRHAVQTPVPAGPVPAVCRIGPDGGRPVADRGIGGTGAPLPVADRGIGGTGIIGVITGFASVCVAGEEVALPPGLAARIDDVPAELDALRAGQVAAIRAAGPPGALQAEQVAVRHAVIGPVQAAGPGMLTVAGQSVLVADLDQPGGAVPARVGEWVAVSGLREPGSNLITATRIDPAPAGRVLVRGELIRSYGAARVGSLTVVLPDGFDTPAGWPVTVSGRLQGGVLVADSALRDTASESPSAYFGPAVTSYIVEGFVAAAAGGFLVDRDFVAGPFSGGRGRGVVRFERGPAGLVVSGGQRDGRSGSGGFTPAPLVPSNTTRPGAAPGGGPAGGFGTSGPGAFGAGGAGPAPFGANPAGTASPGFAPGFVPPAAALRR